MRADRFTIHVLAAHAHHGHGLVGVHAIATVFALVAFICGVGFVARAVLEHGQAREELEEVDDSEPWPV
jgi:hypothetical protein